MYWVRLQFGTADQNIKIQAYTNTSIRQFSFFIGCVVGCPDSLRRIISKLREIINEVD